MQGWGTTAVLLLAGLAVAGDDVRRVRKLVRSKDVNTRLRGVRELIRIDSRDSIRELEALIKVTKKALEKGTAGIDKALAAQLRMLPMIRWLLRRSDAGHNIEAEAGRVMDRWDQLENRIKRLQKSTRVHLQIFKIACWGFVRYRDPGAIKSIESGAVMEPNTMVRIFYIAGMRHSSRKASAPALLGALSSRDPRIRAALLRALVPFAREPGITDGVAPFAEDDNWTVRLGAYQVMAGAQFAKAVEFLCGATRREDGEIALAVDSYLEHLTGQSFAQNPKRWRLWWEKNGDAIRAGTWERMPAEPVASTGETKSVAMFFRIPITSRRILFALDFSGSMSEPIAIRDKQILKIMGRYGLATTRLGYAQAEFIRALSGLPDGALFSVVGYNDDIKRFGSGRMTKLGKATRKRAIRWVVKLKTAELTNIFAALNESFRDYFSAGGASRFRELPDTVLLLTDGIATRGRFTETNDLLDMVRIWNVSTGVVFHCVGLGKGHDAVLLRRLAKETGGYYVNATKKLGDLKPRRRRMPEGFSPAPRPKPKDVRPLPKTGSAVKALIGQFEDGDDDERVAAAKALGAMGARSAEAAPSLAESLTDLSEEVREAASDALAKIGPDAVPALIEALDSDDPHAIQGACHALQAIGKGARAALPSLKKHVSHQDKSLRDAVRDAIAAIR